MVAPGAVYSWVALASSMCLHYSEPTFKDGAVPSQRAHVVIKMRPGSKHSVRCLNPEFTLPGLKRVDIIAKTYNNKAKYVALNPGRVNL